MSDDLHITIKTSAYYRWLPVKADEVQEGDVVVDSTYPGFKMRRTVIAEPDKLTTTVHLPSLHSINSDRVSAGLAPKPHYANLIQHLEDGPWYKMFPPGSIQSVTVDEDREYHERLNDHFLNEAMQAAYIPDTSAVVPDTSAVAPAAIDTPPDVSIIEELPS